MFTPEALSARLDRLATFTAPGPGVTRLVYDDAWCAAHAWLREEAAALDLESTADSVGNLWLHDPGLARGSEVIAVGSHLDSVVRGGRYDGAYGTIAGLMLAAELRGSGTPVAAFVTCEEEGSRFPAALTGVRGLLGELDTRALAELRDRDGIRWERALDAVRARGCAADAPAGGGGPAKVFSARRELELHIEQGPVLDGAGEALGIVDRIAGYRRVRVQVTGESRHAGTTPMNRRRDALTAAAEMALAAEELARDLGPPAVATAGFAHARPGLFNVVPGHCTLGLEVRHTDAPALERLETALSDRVREIARRRDLGLELAVEAGEAPTALSEQLAAQAVSLARALELPHRVMASGAGHDSMAFAQAGVPSLMVFVPSRGGISHAPEEFTEPGALWTGLAFARELLAAWSRDAA